MTMIFISLFVLKWDTFVPSDFLHGTYTSHSNIFSLGITRANAQFQLQKRKSMLPARWCSGESVHIVVGRPGVHSLSRVIPKDFKKWYSQLPCLALSIIKGSVENKPASLLVVSLGKALNGTPPPLCGRQVAPPVLHRIIIVKLLTQHVR